MTDDESPTPGQQPPDPGPGIDDVMSVLGGSSGLAGMFGSGLLKGLIGQDIKSKLRLADRILNGVFELVRKAYEKDAHRADEVLAADDRALSKVASLNELLLEDADPPSAEEGGD